MTFISPYLSSQRIRVDVEVSSRKKLLQAAAGLISEDDDTLDVDDIFKVFAERERLGSTGLGSGVALPHGRIEGLSQPKMAVLKLHQGIDYDASDGQLVRLAIALLVPADATSEHLQILAQIAERCSSAGFCQALDAATTPDQLYRLFTDKTD